MGVIQDILRTMDYGPSPEGAEHVKAWLEAHRNGFGHFINGAFTKPGHLFVDALWYVGDTAGAAQVAALSAGNLKATWTSATAPTGPNRKPARSCAVPRKSKTSGPLRRVGEAIFLEKPRYVSRTV